MALLICSFMKAAMMTIKNAWRKPKCLLPKYLMPKYLMPKCLLIASALMALMAAGCQSTPSNELAGDGVSNLNPTQQ